MAKLSLLPWLALCIAVAAQAHKPKSNPYERLYTILGEAEDYPWQQTAKKLTALLHGVDRVMLKKLIKEQGEPDLYDALFWAVFHSDTRFVTWLLQQGADPNTSYNNMSMPRPLFAATEATVAARLLDHGADIHKKTIAGQGLLDLAIDPRRVKDNRLFPLYIKHGLIPWWRLPNHGASLWHILANTARWVPEEHVLPRAELLARLNVPANIPDPATGQTPAVKVKQHIKQVGKSLDPFVFGQTRKLSRLLAVIRRVVRK